LELEDDILGMSNSKTKTIFVQAIAWLILPVFLVMACPAPRALAVTSDFSRSYIVKLNSPGNFSELLPIAQNINHRFLGMQAEEFKNIYTFDSNYSIADLKIALNGHFNYLQTNRTLQTAGVVVNDPGFSSNGQDIDKQWGLIKSGFDNAWNKTVGDKRNIVAVIDTGIDQTHEDLKNIFYVPGFDFISKQGLSVGSNSDDNGHGTLVSGVLGAAANNGIGIAGTNWQITLMPLKALDSSGKGDVVAIAEAIVWATDHGAQFINLSIGGIGFGHDTALANAVSYAFARNVLLVAAAGNDSSATGSNLDQSPIFPICDDNNFNMVIGVAAIDKDDIKPEFSNYGRNCVDVVAPGKRILSTINFDPLSKKSAPNSYAYASGTSLGVPFVVGQAALIKALYPFATNVQIRDRIISTAEQIDNLNLTQCAGVSCRGLLGAGRINVPKSLETAIAQNFSEGDLVKDQNTGAVYQILGGQKRLVSPFVLNQKFSDRPVKILNSNDLSTLPSGSYITPIDGTLIKLDNEPTVYILDNGLKLPITYQVFMQRKLSFAQVNTLSYSEVNSWQTGSFYSPAEGTLVKSAQNKTVFWVIGQTLHPINYGFYIDRGLNLFPVLAVSKTDLNGFAKGEAYIR
jgi:hypothetical protein